MIIDSPAPERVGSSVSGLDRATGPVPAPVSAERLHTLALEAFRIGNRGRISLCEALRVLAETRLYFELGYPSVAAYAGAFFQLRRSEAFEYVRVAKALVALTTLREAFAKGRVGWSAVKAITRVANADSQADWIEFARTNGVESTLAEARDALRHGRHAPRRSSYGLPNLDEKLVLRYPRSDMDKVRRWLEQTCAEIADRTGTDEVSLEQAILFLCERGAATEVKESPGTDRSVTQDARAQIVYQRCPDCSRARVGTRDGFVEVAPKELDRYASSAEPVVIDGPTPPGLRRKILAREAGRCANPRCGEWAAHCHHVVFLSKGGKTRLDNEVAVCTACHALIHAGLLDLRGDANGELCWSPVVAPSPAHAAASDRSTADRLPVLHLECCGSGDVHPQQAESAFADSLGAGAVLREPDSPELDPAELATGLTRLGVSVRRSRRIIDDVLKRIPPSERTESRVLSQAVASI